MKNKADILTPQEFLEKLQSIKTKKAQENLCAKLIAALKKKHPYALSSVRNKLTIYRNTVRKENPEHFVLQVNPKKGASPLALPKEENQAVNKKTESGVEHRLKNLQFLSDEIIEQFTSTARQLLDSKNVFDAILGICAVTACRPGEAARATGFEPLDENAIRFTGQTKKRGKQIQPIEKNILCSVHQLNKAIEFIQSTRPDFADMDAVSLNRAIAASLSQRVKKYFHFLPLSEQEIETRLLRSIAAEALYRRFGKQIRWEHITYINYVLGHEPISNPTMAYLRFVETN